MWEKIKKNKKRNIILAIILFFLFCIGMSEPSTQTNKTEDVSNDTNSNYVAETKEVVEENVATDIKSLEFLYKSAEVDISETKDFILNVKPIEAAVEKVEIISSNESILKIERNSKEIERGKISFKIIPISEGEVTILARVDDIKTPENMTIKVIDNARIEREKKQQEEERERIDAAKKQAEAKTASSSAKSNNAQSGVQSSTNNSRKQTNTQSSSSYNSSTNSNSSNPSSTSKPASSTTNYNGQTVYITPSGKKYHYLSTCGGKNSKPIDLDSAKSSGYEPCKKCVH